MRFDGKLRLMPPDKQGGKRIFIFGGSEVNLDFDESILNASSSIDNLIFYKLPLPMGVSSDFFQFKARLAEHQPDLIIITRCVGHFYIPDRGFFAFQWFFPHNVLWQHTFNPAILAYVIKYFGIKDVIKDNKIYIGAIVNKVFYARRYQRELARLLLIALTEGFGTKESMANEEYYFTKQQDDSDYQRSLEMFREERMFARGRVVPFLEELFVDTVRFFVRKGIKIIIIDIPLNPLIKEAYDSELDDLYHQFIISVPDKTGSMLLSHDDLPKFEKNEFLDLTHLNEEGRRKMSLFLREYIEKNFQAIFQDVKL